MVITKTPLRMSFFGGGTDIKEFYEQYGGSVISTTFDKYCYVTVRHLPPFFEYKNEIVYSITERTIIEDTIKHPLVRNCMKYLDMHEMRVAYECDLPARTGLATSSSFAVGLLNAFYSLKGKYVDKNTLANDAIYVERVMCKEAGGLQDQIAVSFGGFNKIDFKSSGFSIHPIIINDERKNKLNENLLLLYTGIKRNSFEIQEIVKKDLNKKTDNLKEILNLVSVAYKILIDRNADLDEFGKLLDYTWKLKRDVSNKISTNDIDILYDKALKYGALGGKVLGAGGGGFLLLYVPKEKQESFKKAFNDFLFVPIKFEDKGTEVIYYKPEILEKMNN